MPSEYEPGGWPDHLEDRAAIARLPNDEAVCALFGSYHETRFDPRAIIKVEHQKSQGACAGHSLSSVMEFCHALQTGTTGHQLSRGGAYYETQRIDRISGDRGSTIQGGVQLATTWGLPEESQWPYPGRYDNTRPQNWEEVTANAAQHKIGNAIRIDTYDGFRTFLGSGQGGIHVGIGWNKSVNRGIVESYSNGGGGHAICALCLSDRVDSKGQPYGWILNSWGKSFGQSGWSEWSPKAISQMLRQKRTVMIGMSDMPGVEARKFSVDEWKAELRVA